MKNWILPVIMSLVICSCGGGGVENENEEGMSVDTGTVSETLSAPDSIPTTDTVAVDSI